MTREELIEMILEAVSPEPKERRYHGTNIRNLAKIARRGDATLWTTADAKTARFYASLPSGEKTLLKKGQATVKAVKRRGIDVSKAVRKYHVTGSPEVKRHARVPKEQHLVLALGDKRPRSRAQTAMQRKSMWSHAGARHHAKHTDIRVVGASGKLTPIRQAAKERLQGIKAGKIKVASRPLPK
jgi:hypothetical protein